MTDKTQTIMTLEDLRNHRTAILDLAKQYHARKVSVFGSLVQGTASEDSDIDFLVEFEPDYKLRDLIRLVGALQELLGRRVDVADADNLRDEMRPHILETAEPL
jgi:hypothetical protein